MLDAGDGEFRRVLLVEQGKCAELAPLLEAAYKLLGATNRESTVEAEALTKDYRLNNEDGVLERAVDVAKARIWVPVMPALPIPAEFFAKPRDEATWRRYAFEMAHATFLEPHRSSSSSWQALKRIGFWQSMYKDKQLCSLPSVPYRRSHGSYA